MADDLYAALGVPRSASSEEISAAYRRRTEEFAASGVLDENRRRVEEAFETLGDPIARLRYDGRALVPPPRAQRFPAQSSRPRTAPRRRQGWSRRPLLRLNVNQLLAIGIVLAVVGASVVLVSPIFRRSNVPPEEEASAPSVAASAPVTAISAKPAASGQPGATQPPSVLSLPASATGSGPSLLASPPTEPLFVSRNAFPSAIIAVAAASLAVNRPVVTTPLSAAPIAAPTSPALATAGSPTPVVTVLATSTPVRLTATSAPNRIFVPTASVARPTGGGGSSASARPVASPNPATPHLP